MDLSSLVANLKTNWKDDPDFMKIIMKHNAVINSALEKEYATNNIYPPQDLILNAFNQFNKEELKVVIIGQDSYINKGEAMGLCFSVPQGIKTPPSLRNILKEIKNRTNPDLTDIAQQGVLMLNRALTVRESRPMSHMPIWESFTEDVIKFIAKNFSNIVYMLWGNPAKELTKHLDVSKNLILTHSHPSPLSRRPFVGNNHFNLCNEYLIENNKTPVSWQ
jgi:uracil-DNA glycosylase